MQRREFITLLGGVAAAWPVVARAQSAKNVRRVGILWPGASPPASPRLESFREGLREAGFIEGENLVIELRYSKTGLQHLPELAAELVRLKVEVIEASGDFAPRVAQATSAIPIVAFTDDVLGAGLVDSLSRPGGNTTGLTILAPELSAKRLEVLSEIVPGLSRVAALWDPTSGVASRDNRDCSPCYEDTIANPGGPTSRSPCRRVRCGQGRKSPSHKHVCVTNSRVVDTGDRWVGRRTPSANDLPVERTS